MTKIVSNGLIFQDGSIQRTSGMIAGIDAKGSINVPEFIYYPPNTFPLTIRAKMANAVAGRNGCKIAIAGASNVAGYDGSTNQRGLGKSYPERFRNALAAYGYPIGSGSARMCDASTPDTRFALGGTWSSSGSGTGHPFWFTTTVGATATFTADEDGTTLDFEVAAASPACTFSFTVDGVAPHTISGATVTTTHCTYTTGSVTTDATNNVGKISVTGLPNRRHTAVATVTATGLTPIGADCYNPTDIRITNFGSSGSRSAYWQDTSVYYTLQNLLLNYAPDVCFFDLGIMFNDFQGAVAQATSISQTKSVISAVQAASIEVVLIQQTPGISATAGTPAASWYNAGFGIADAQGCVYIDNYDRWKASETIAQGLNLVNSIDTVHPTVDGYVDLGLEVIRGFNFAPVGRPVKPGPLVANSGSSYTIPDTALDNGRLVLTLNAATPAITLPTKRAGATITLTVVQDGTGSRVPTWDATIDWGTSGAPTLTTTAGKMDTIVLDCPTGDKWNAYAAGLGF